MAQTEALLNGGVAIIGAGMAGLSAAQVLLRQGIAVHVYDMGRRGPGGRSSSRRVDHDTDLLYFDHGCQFIRASEPAFAAEATKWEQKGLIAPWEGRLGLLDAATGSFIERGGSGETSAAKGFCNIMEGGQIYVGVPAMDAICRGLAEEPNLQSSWGSRVMELKKLEDGMWQVTAEGKYDDMETGKYRAVILADIMTARKGSPGSLQLGAAESSPVIQQLRKVRASPVYTLMLALQRKHLLAPFDGAAVTNDETIQWIARDTSKPGRERPDDLECWVAITTEAFTQKLLAEAPPAKDGGLPPQTRQHLEAFAPRIWEALWEVLQPFSELNERPQPAFLQAQRWGGGFKTDRLPQPCLVDEQLALAACGDFCGAESAAQAAVLSGLAAGRAVAALLQK